jgi:tellurite resistance protein TerC
VFGAFLIFTGLKMLAMEQPEPDPSRNPVVRLTRRLLPVTDSYHGPRFFVRAGGAPSRLPAEPGAPCREDAAVARAKPGSLLATPLLVALVTVEFADLVFAVDSIPAILAITADPFLVFTSNVFAILGLRSLYFALAGMLAAFRYLKVALAGVLVVVGIKMLAHAWLQRLLGDSFTLWVLGVVLAILAAGVVASLAAPTCEPAPGAPAGPLEDR